MSKKVYGWGADNVLNFYDLVPDDYQLQANQTFDSPLVLKDGVSTLNQPTKRVAGGWQQPTEEEHKAWIEANQKLFPQPQKTEPVASPQDQAIMELGQQVGTLTVANQQTAKMAQQAADAVSALGQQVATIIAKNN